MGSTLLVSTISRSQYCSVHQRAWVEALGQWVACPEPTINGSPATEAACDTCAALVLQTFRAQFPALYSSRFILGPDGLQAGD
jgi:hypothetical protein